MSYTYFLGSMIILYCQYRSIPYYLSAFAIGNLFILFFAHLVISFVVIVLRIIKFQGSVFVALMVYLRYIINDLHKSLKYVESPLTMVFFLYFPKSILTVLLFKQKVLFESKPFRKLISNYCFIIIKISFKTFGTVPGSKRAKSKVLPIMFKTNVF